MKKIRIDKVAKVISIFALACSIFFLLLPLIVIVGSSFGDTPYLTFPPIGLTLRWYFEALGLKQFVQPLLISIQLGIFVATASTILGLLASLAIVRYDFPGKNLLNNLLLSPLIIPLVVTGMALYRLFTTMGMRAPFINLAIGHIIITLPYALRTIEACLQVFDVTLEEAAMTLGANRLQTFLKVTFPLIKPGVIAGWLFAFAMSFDEFVVAIFLTTPGFTTFPIEFFYYIRWSINPTVAVISTFLIIYVLVLVIILDRTVGLRSILGILKRA